MTTEVLFGTISLQASGMPQHVLLSTRGGGDLRILPGERQGGGKYGGENGDPHRPRMRRAHRIQVKVKAGKRLREIWKAG